MRDLRIPWIDRSNSLSDRRMHPSLKGRLGYSSARSGRAATGIPRKHTKNWHAPVRAAFLEAVANELSPAKQTL